MSTTYVTVAIPYVNAEPHLGYAYELVEADIYARARRLAGDDVRLLGGTDDHALKNVLAAEAAGLPTDVYVDANAARFAALAEPLGRVVRRLLPHQRRSPPPAGGRAAVAGLRRQRRPLPTRRTTGDYCVGCERFYDCAELIAVRTMSPAAPSTARRSSGSPRRTGSSASPATRSRFERLIPSGELAVHPQPFRRRGPRLPRQRARRHQRVRVRRLGPAAGASRYRTTRRRSSTSGSTPSTNYLSALEFGDPDSVAYRRWWLQADRRVHVVGKGILRLPRRVLAGVPASAGQPLPTRVQVHPYLTVDGAKISKSGAHDDQPVHARRPLRHRRRAVVVRPRREPRRRHRLHRAAARRAGRPRPRQRDRQRRQPHRHAGPNEPESRSMAAATPIDGVAGLDEDVLGALADFDLRARRKRSAPPSTPSTGTSRRRARGS